MAKDDICAKVTVEQGNALFTAAAGKFVLPEKLGSNSYDLVARTAAEEEVRTLFNELKGYSPMHVKDRRLLFGPAEAWKRVSVEDQYGRPATGHSLEDPLCKLSIRISQDARNGAFWILLMLTHPDSQHKTPVSAQVDMLWPLAEALRLAGALRKELGLVGVQHRRIDLDPETPASEPQKAEATA